MEKETRRVSVGKIIAISAAVALLIFTALIVAYKLFKKYFKISFDCGDCDSCQNSCFDDAFDPFCMDDDDFAPSCSLCDDEDEDFEAEEVTSAE